MNIYRLRPRAEGLESSHWQASTYKGACLVYADNVDEAITFAHREFQTAAPKPPLGEVIPTNPWADPDLVMIAEIDHITGPLPAKGTVAI